MNLPTALECMFDRSLLEEKAVKQPYGIALGTRGSWMIAFTDLEGNSERFGVSPEVKELLDLELTRKTLIQHAAIILIPSIPNSLHGSAAICYGD